MKTKKIITLTIVVLLIIAVAVTSIVLAGSKSTRQGIEEKDRTSVVLVPEQTVDGVYTGKVDVYLEMDDGMNITEEDKEGKEDDVVIKDAASIASFQIGLNIHARAKEDTESEIKFEYDSNLQENKDGVELARQTKTPITTTQTAEDGTKTTTTVGENLNLYFVGTKELNDVNSSEPLKVGTITLNKSKLGDNATVSITPEGTDESGNVHTMAASIGHNPTEITVDPVEDRVEFILNPNNNPEVDPDTGDGDEGDGDEGGDSGNTGSGSGDSGDTGNISDGSGDSGDTGNIGDGSGDSGDSEDVGSGSGSQDLGTQVGDNDGNDDTSNNSTNTKKPSILNKIKTGANHSLFRIIIPLAILIVLAILVIFLKTRINGKKSKH